MGANPRPNAKWKIILTETNKNYPEINQYEILYKNKHSLFWKVFGWYSGDEMHVKRYLLDVAEKCNVIFERTEIKF